ncbi:MAG: hypothetical protein M3O46_02315 [Myxococcota bacterium]|nr:hypothetical protein [Myxococcota bacterium]
MPVCVRAGLYVDVLDPSTALARPELAFASPRKLPRARDLKGRVVVLDVAFASEAVSGGFEKITLPFIEQLGPRLAGWVDHHDHVMHERYRADPRFVLATKAEHGACPEMVTPEVILRIGQVETIVCHTDFDGLCSAAKWLRGGTEPYLGADADAHAIDTRTGVPSSMGQRIDRALRARPRDTALFGVVVRHLADGLRDASLWEPVDGAARELAPIEELSRRISGEYVVVDIRGGNGVPAGIRSLAFVDATSHHGHYDKTLLLLLGQERAGMAIVVDLDTVTLAARYDSGVSFIELLGLSGGMPTLVSVPKKRLLEAISKLGMSDADLARLVS